MYENIKIQTKIFAFMKPVSRGHMRSFDAYRLVLYFHV